MGRREDRERIQSTWSTYTARVPGTPFRQKDLEDAEETQAIDQKRLPDEVEPSAWLPLILLARASRR